MQLQIPQIPATRGMSLRTQLILFGLAVAIPFLAFWTWALRSYSQAEHTASEQKARSYARDLSKSVEHDLRRLAEQLQSLTSSTALRTNDLERLHKRVSHVGEIYRTVIVIRDAGGQQIINTRVPFGAALPASRLPEEGRTELRKENLHISNLYRGAVSNNQLVTVTIPVFRDGRLVNSISMAVDPARLLQGLGISLPPEGWISSIADRQGTIIASTHDHEALIGTPAQPIVHAGAATAEQGIDEIVTASGQRVLRAYHRMAFSGWMVTVALPFDRLEKPFAVRWQTLASASGLLLILTSVLSYAMANSLIGEFQGMTSQAAALVMGGEIEKRPSRLYEANQMIASLDAASQQLRDRTEALRCSEEQLRVVFDGIPVGMFRTDLNKNIIYANPHLQEMANSALGDVNSRKWLDELPPESRRMLEGDWAADIAEKGYFEREFLAHSVRRGLGDLHILIHAVADRDAAGQLIGYIGTVTEITRRKRAELALTDEIDRFRRLTQASPDGIFLHDVTSHEITFLNRSLHDALGLGDSDAATIGAARFYDLLDGEDIDAYQAHVAAMRQFADGKLDQIEIRVGARMEKPASWLLLRTVVFTRHPDGRVNQILCIASDITARKQAAAIVAIERDRFERMGLASPDVVFLYDLPRRARTHINRPWAQVLGFKEDDADTRPDERPLQQFLLPEDRKSLQEHLRGLPQLRDGAVAEFEFRARAADGSVRWFLIRSVVFERAREGNVRQMLGIATDITTRKQAERMLADENDRFKRIAFASPDLVYLYDRQARGVSFMNRSLHETLGYPPGHEASPGADEMFALIFPEDLEGAHEHLRSIARADDRKFAEYVCRFRGPGGVTRWVRNRAVVFSRHPDGRAHQILGIVTDITEAKLSAEAIARSNIELEARVAEEVARREQAQRELARAHKLEAIGRLTGAVAHDFANMLSVITTSLEVFQLKHAKDVAMELIDDALAGADTGQQLTQQLLSFARRKPVAPTSIDLNDHLGSNVRWVENTLGPDIEVRTTFADGVGHVVLDEAGLDSAIINLVMNARDAMPDGGALLIDTGNVYLAANADEGIAAGDYVFLAITDTGSGMAPEVQQRAFDPFFSTKASDGRGTGLGLSSVYGFVKQSRGRVEVRSTQGFGTSVILYFPRNDRVPRVRNLRRDAGRVIRGAGQVVMVVEDLDELRERMGDLLRTLGYVPLLAENGAAARDRIVSAMAAGERIDIVMSDLRMPGGVSGRDLACWIAETAPHIPVVLMSGYDEEQTRRDAVSGGDEAPLPRVHLTKPFTPAELTQCLHTAMQFGEPPGA